MIFLVNDSPLAGTEGDKVTSRVIRDRFYKEAESNVAMKIEDFRVQGRFRRVRSRRIATAMLIETMRREGFELRISRPRVCVPEG